MKWVHIDKLNVWDRNPRRNDGRPVADVAASIRRFGFVSPVVVWTSMGRVVAGHTRIKAIRAILKEDPSFVVQETDSETGDRRDAAPGPGFVPVRHHEFSGETQANAYALADNRLGELSEWDDDALTSLLKDLELEGALDGLGWDDDELKILLDDVSVADVKWKEFDETIGNDAPKGKTMTCPHCGESFDA
jgi:ParB-like chromosome segregation protein Spo0J